MTFSHYCKRNIANELCVWLLSRNIEPLNSFSDTQNGLSVSYVRIVRHFVQIG